MAYKVSGSIQEPTTITVLNSDGIAQKTQSFSAGAWEIDGLVCPSGTIIGFEEDDTFKGFGNVPFIEYDTRPSVPWTDTFLPEVDRTRWINYDLNPAYIYNNKMRMRTNSANTHCNIQSKYLISGDFDIELSFTLVEAPAITEWQLFFRLYFPCAAETISDDTSVQIRRCYNGANRYYFQGYNGGTPFATNVSVSDTSGKVRFVRSGSVITGYYWNGSSWTSIANQDYGTNFSGYPVRLLIGQNSLTGLPDAIIDYTDFKINSGTIQYRFDDRFNYNINYINPDTDVYKAVGGYPFPYTYNGKLRFDLSSTRPIADADLKEKLVGDFDVSVDCNILNGPATNQWQFKIMLFNSDFTYAVRVARYYIASVGHCFRSEITVAGVLDTYNVITTETNVSFRVKRIGTSLYTYYKAQSTAIWTLHRTTNGFTTDDLTCRLHGGTAYGAIAAADFDSLVINNANGINNKLLVDIPSNIPTTIPEPNTTLLLHFDESPLVDSSYNKYPLTLNGGVAYAYPYLEYGMTSGYYNFQFRKNESNDKYGETFSLQFNTYLKYARFRLCKAGSPTGNIWAELYAVDGNNIPIGSPIATSSTILASSLSVAPTYTTTQFNFSGSVPISGNTYYAIVLNGNCPQSSSNYICGGYENPGTFSGGISVVYTYNTWTTPAVDLGFTVGYLGRFGGYSGEFNGSTQFISLADSDDWNFGGGDFTVDFWINFSAPINSVQSIVGQNGSSSRGWSIYKPSDSGSLHFTYKVTGAGAYNDLAFSTSLTTGVWYHVAAIRNGSNLDMYLNGARIGTTHNIGSGIINDANSVLYIGENVENRGYYTRGYIDELRISKGIARWTSDFTPPTSAYSA